MTIHLRSSRFVCSPIPKVKAEYDVLAPKFEIAAELFRARLRAGLSQKELAVRMRTSQSAVARLESGDMLPSTKTLLRYAQATGTRLACGYRRLKASRASTNAWQAQLSSHHGSFHGQRQGNRTKRLLRIEIILAGLIDNPKQTVFLGSGIAKHDVDLPLFKRNGIALVIDAYEQLFRLCLCHGFEFQSRYLTLVSLPPDSGGLVPVYFSRMDSAIHQSHAGDALNAYANGRVHRFFATGRSREFRTRWRRLQYQRFRP